MWIVIPDSLPAISFGSEITSMKPRREKLVALSFAGKFKEEKKPIPTISNYAEEALVSRFHTARSKSAIQDRDLQLQFTSHFIPSNSHCNLARSLQLAAFRLQIRITDAMNHRKRRKQRQYPQSRSHHSPAVEQCAQNNAYNPLRPLHEPHLTGSNQRLGSSAGVAHH